MYKVNYKTKDDAFHRIYKFMTLKDLTKPECTIWQEPNILTTIHGGSRLPTEKYFIKKLSSFDMTAISCVAGMDKEDKNRVVLTYYPDLEFMVLDYPLKDNITEKENALVSILNE